MMTHIDPLNRNQKIEFLRIQDGGPPPFEDVLNRHNSATVQRIAMKFDMVTQFDPLKPSDGQKFEFLKTKVADGRCWDMFAVDILKVTQQGIAPVRRRC